MLDSHICTHFDTFHCKQTTCVLHVNVKTDGATKNEIQAIFNNKKKEFPNCPSFGQFSIHWRLLKSEYQYWAQNMLDVSFKLCVDWCNRDAASCLTLSVFILTCEGSKPKTEMHIKHCISRSKTIPIQEAHKLFCVDAAASYADNLFMRCFASLVDNFW